MLDTQLGVASLSSDHLRVFVFHPHELGLEFSTHFILQLFKPTEKLNK